MVSGIFCGPDEQGVTIISGFEHQFGEIHPHFYMLVISITIIYNFYSTTAKSFKNYILVSLYIYLLPWPVNV